MNLVFLLYSHQMQKYKYECMYVQVLIFCESFLVQPAKQDQEQLYPNKSLIYKYYFFQVSTQEVI